MSVLGVHIPVVDGGDEGGSPLAHRGGRWDHSVTRHYGTTDSTRIGVVIIVTVRLSVVVVVVIPCLAMIFLGEGD